VGDRGQRKSRGWARPEDFDPSKESHFRLGQAALTPVELLEDPGAGPELLDRAGTGPGRRDLVDGRYRLQSLVARGGQADVYRATHLVTCAPVALKLFRSQSAATLDRFEMEARAPHRIGHPALARVLDAGFDEDGTPFLAFEMLHGMTLRERLSRERALTLREVLGLFERLLEPLAALHRARLVHRDLKPSNVFLLREPDPYPVRLLDLGMAKDLLPGAAPSARALGHAEYASPEQRRDPESVTPASDVFTLGVLVFEVISAAKRVALDAARRGEPAQPGLDVPPLLRRLLGRCLSPDPRDRPSDADAVLAQVERLSEVHRMATAAD
jgi:serine/threonine protein kinase